MALTLVWITPIQSEAWCTMWYYQGEGATYCATPVCHLSIPAQYTDQKYERYCYNDSVFSTTEYKIEKEYHGCCPNP